MSEKDHCKLRVSIFSRWGKAEHWLFGDFLKYCKNNLVSEKPEVVIKTANHGKKVKNPIVISWDDKEPPPSFRKNNFKDGAVIGYHEKQPNRIILCLRLSSYLRSVIEDDMKAGNNIHIFDLEFRKEDQMHEEFSFKGLAPSLTNNLDKIKKPALTEKFLFKSGFKEAIWIAKVITHRSIHLDEYIKVVQTDPVWRAGLKLYFDPLTHDFYKKKYGLGDYLDRFREQCDVPF